jgi:hypothetical protein
VSPIADPQVCILPPTKGRTDYTEFGHVRPVLIPVVFQDVGREVAGPSWIPREPSRPTHPVEGWRRRAHSGSHGKTARTTRPAVSSQWKRMV